MSGIFIGGGGSDYRTPQVLKLDLANRHGLIAGATGTGKTVTMQILAEGFSAAGVPVFMADVKGDVSGLGKPGAASDRITARAAQIGLADYAPAACPVVFWDIFGQSGHPVRTTVTELGPLLLARMLDLTDVQEGVLNIAFRICDDQGMALLDLDDLRAVLNWIGDNTEAVQQSYGHVARASLGAVQRALLVLENQGVRGFLGEPALQLSDLMTTDAQGRGQVNILMADTLITTPRLYAMFLLWLLSELFEELPEVGNPDKPKLVFFFDEAHLLFDTAPKSLLQRIEQVVRLVRSKGVGVYFVSQLPDDIPEDVLSQLGNRIQHALRAFTPRDAKALKTAAETFRPNPAFDTATAIQQVGTGEAVVSLLEDKAIPGMVDRVLIRPPASQMGPLTEDERRALITASPLGRRYDTAVDRRSAHEILADRAAAKTPQSTSRDELKATFDTFNRPSHSARPSPGRATRYTGKNSPGKSESGSMASTLGEAFATTMVQQLSTRRGRRMVRGLLGSLLKR
ncbi:helicase HerA-like domain-containing protein [Fluviibacterium sp. DFM31]|uniref:Helicase HerA-like domain-containing protein n=1 Tax=Meridianimarinicoccus marinus TaxID=3231483 RepID=A0ABV3L2T7_9RHOB